MTISYRSAFIDSWEAKGEAKGEARGEAKAKVDAILETLDVRGLKPDKKQRAKITGSTDLDQLSTWFRKALTTSTIDEIFT